MDANGLELKQMMTRRIAVALALMALLLVLAAIGGTAFLLKQQAEEIRDRRLMFAARGFTRELTERLATAEALIQSLTGGDIGQHGVGLRQRILRSDLFVGVVLTDWVPPTVGRPNAANTQTALPPLNPADGLALLAGQTLVRFAPRETGVQTPYLIHLARGGDTPALAFFELSPSWLWDALPELDGMRISVAVLDDAGHSLHAERPVAPQMRQLAAGPVGRDRATPIAEWSSEGRQIISRGLRVDWAQARINGDGAWTVIACTDWSIPWGLLSDAGAAALPALLLSVVLVLIGSLYLRGRWEPILGKLAVALAQLREGQFTPVPLDRAADTPRLLAESFNRTIATLEARTRTLQALAQIDRLLLESTEFEQSLDAILAHICAVTGCRGAAITLIDPDAPGHGRSFVVINGSADRPVCRIGIDEQMLETLAESPQGLTIARCEPERHSFLEPLRVVGAEFFWVWPVAAQQQVAAVLAVGYDKEPAALPQLSAYGTECAARLAIALSRRLNDERLYRQAHYDSLTALPNRLLFRDRLSQEIASTVDGSQRGALLYVDLDHFKKVNDSMGHIAGDQLLTIVAQRLRSCVKDGDTVARLGGDEFSVILRNIDSPEAARDVAARIIESLRRPVNVGGRDHRICASIGITLFPDDGNTIEQLMRNADLAMYQAKDNGRSRATFFDGKIARPQSPAVAASGLYRALRRREFSLYYQPQYSLSSGALIGLEALLRWQPPRESMRLPGEFVPAAEESGLIVDIGIWVLEAACTQLAEWRQQNIAPQRLALNVSAQQLRGPEFTRLVQRVLERTDIPPHMLELELTESVLADEEARQTLNNLAALGVRLALDDFGTGYSSLSYLRRHPVHAIKIDRSFVQEVAENVQAAALAETIIKMAHALNKEVIAEGVETIDQLEFLRERGCDAAQGFALARPAGVVEVTELLRARRVQPTALLQRLAG
ncbi:MAG: putative bifunctional diguanylate cyclase/phosphodiesterase [Steroidobacterales bacterium]